jgi:hypothetical protein
MVPAPVLTEVCWLLERERGSKAEASLNGAGTETFRTLRRQPVARPVTVDRIETVIAARLGVKPADLAWIVAFLKCHLLRRGSGLDRIRADGGTGWPRRPRTDASAGSF